MDNALLPWFILVPKTDIIELCDLPDEIGVSLSTAIRQLSHHLREQFPVEKLNVAAIGNVVKQLHVHIVGRHHQDYCWPGVVWGRPERKPYDPAQIDRIQNQLQEALQGSFICHPLRQESSR
ncbi:MAG: HIT family protein [Gammaproteobacteria bacterium]|nr:HIT family protein [Gammaproteobacteria bacterium]